jgi:hypothetical protein
LAALVVVLSWPSVPAPAQNPVAEPEKPAAASERPADASKPADEFDRRLRRIERAIERLGGKLDDNLDPNIIQVAPDPGIAIPPIQTTIQWLDLTTPEQAEHNLKALKKKRSELVEKLLETFDEIRETEARIVQARKRFSGAYGQ